MDRFVADLFTIYSASLKMLAEANIAQSERIAKLEAQNRAQEGRIALLDAQMAIVIKSCQTLTNLELDRMIDNG